jgi:hypothetical protein
MATVVVAAAKILMIYADICVIYAIIGPSNISSEVTL